MEDGARIIVIGSAVGQRVVVPRARALRGHEGSRAARRIATD